MPPTKSQVPIDSRNASRSHEVAAQNNPERLRSRTASPAPQGLGPRSFHHSIPPSDSSTTTAVEPPSSSRPNSPKAGLSSHQKTDFKYSDSFDDDFDFDEEDTMSRPNLNRPTDGRSFQPLLGNGDASRQSYDEGRPARGLVRSASMRSRDPAAVAQHANRKKYTYAAFFLGLSLVSFVIQTETAVYIQKNLKWNKAYCMLWMTHGSWSLLWPTMLLIQRLRKPKVPWEVFWRQHKQLLRSTAQMVQYQTLHPQGRQSQISPLRYMIKMTAIVTTALTVAGASWYVSVNLTTPSDLTAIYNCSAFFAYAFSIPLLKEKIRFDKMASVAVAIIGVLVVAYGDTAITKHGGKSGGAVGGSPEDQEASNRALGNIVIGVGSVLYGFYEVLYKKVACPPEGCSPGRGMAFALTFGSLIGTFTLLVLWIPMPILHVLGIERFELPRGKTALILFISVIMNATFSGSFLVLISLTSPVLSSVAALLTIFLVAIVDWFLTGIPLSFAAICGGLLIIGAFLLLSWSTVRELNEEKRKKLETDMTDSDSDM
ncbi:MAG: hypothetical protein M1814_005263 [Vezdaea aestivalis]|nr:MAG: hypothetical protein M1814_005263 [Vezdaea aestivalis]